MEQPAGDPAEGGRTDPALFVEVLGRDGEVVSRVRLARLPFTLGRAYDSDLIVDDPYVAPHHLRIEAGDDGTPVVADLGSANGTLDLGSGGRLARTALRDDQHLRIGHTRVRLRTAAHPVPPERVDRGARLIERYWFSVAALLALMGYALLDAHIQRNTPRDTHELLVNPVAWAVSAYLWATLWALACRLFSGRARFVAHVAVGTLGILALILLRDALDLAAFALDLPALARHAFVVLTAAGAALVFAHLLLIRPLRPRRMALACGTLAATAIALMAASNWQTQGRTGRGTFMSTLSYPQLLVRPPMTLDAFLERSGELRHEVDAAAARETERP
jgi:hypothetical protein